MAKVKRRNEILAGLFVLLALAAIFVILILVADFGTIFGAHAEYTVTFAVIESVEGLITGAPVKLGGYRVGNVTRVEPRPAKVEYVVRDENGKPVLNPDGTFKKAERDGWEMRVTIRIDARYTLHDEEVSVELVRPVLGTDAALNISNVGHGNPLKAGDVIDGRIATAPFLADAVRQLGFGDNEREAVQEAIQRVRAFVAALETTGKEIETLMTEGGDIRQIIDNVNVASEKLTRLMSNADTAVASIRDMVAKDGIVMQIAQRIDDAAQQAVDILKENRQSIKDAIANAAKIAQEGADGVQEVRAALRPILAKVDKAITTANEALTGFRDLTATAEGLIQRNRVPINAMVDDYRIMAGNLKATSAEVRANPWRLLYQPTEDDKKKATLHDAARSFATGAGQVRNATQILADALAASDAEALADDPNVKAAVQTLRDSIANFGKVERFLLKETAQN